MKKYLKEINYYVAPLFLNHLWQSILSLIGLSIIVRNSTETLGALSVIQSFLSAMGGLLGAANLAFNIKGAKALGAEDEEGFSELLKSSLTLNVIIGGAFMIFALLFGYPLLRYFYGLHGATLELATNYLFVMSPCILLTVFTFTLANLIKVEKKTKWVLYISLLTDVLEIYLYIKLVPLYGVIGAGFATILGLVLNVVLYAIITRERLLRSLKFRAKRKLELIRLATPLMGQEILESVIFIMVFEALIARLGVESLAIYAIVALSLVFLKMAGYMYAGSLNIFLGEAIGGGENRSGKRAVIFAAGLSAMVSYVVIAVVLLWNMTSFSSFFSKDARIVGQMPQVCLVIFIAMIAFPLYEISKYALQTSGQENFVVRLTGIINIASLAVMILGSVLKVTNLIELNVLYGLNLLVLSLIFIYRLIKIKVL
jgi:Na+-driven multidrug efflux pump